MCDPPEGIQTPFPTLRWPVYILELVLCLNLTENKRKGEPQRHEAARRRHPEWHFQPPPGYVHPDISISPQMQCD